MVNLKAIIYVKADGTVTHFGTPAEFEAWIIGRCPTQAFRNRYLNAKRLAVAGEQTLEQKYNLAKGQLENINLIFNTTARADQYLRILTNLKLFKENQIITLEMRPSKSYNIATFYGPEESKILKVKIGILRAEEAEPAIPISSISKSK